MTIVSSLAMIAVGYLIGAMPMGYFVIRMMKDQDVTQIGSGRTGGTNAMRAGGLVAGVLTAVLDLLKGYMAVELAEYVVPGALWVHVLAGVAAVVGHNWSIWLYWLTGKVSAGAGTGPNVGAAMSFWFPMILVAIPVMAFFILVVGYASVASILMAVSIVVVFLLRYLWLGTPYEYIIYGVLTTIVVTWALRPNIVRLLHGTERRVGIFAKKQQQTGND